ncbi:MAG: hypothetical protein CW338_00905 [Clostridiales bacterium]|nr:hypothetical protein [Clostridiales bacterium]
MKSVLSKLKDILFPAGRCMGCDHPRGADRDGLCSGCRAAIAGLTIPADSCNRCLSHVRRNRPCAFCAGGGMKGIDRMYAPYRYRAQVRNLIHLLKFNHEERAAGLLGSAMADALTNRDFDCIVPVPLHRLRLRDRGYNQSALLAGVVSEKTGIPVREDLLRRIRATRAQSSLKEEERAGNVENAFEADSGCAGLRILLLDDVRTSGNTARACARALREKGAAAVSLLTAALVWNHTGAED